MCQFKSIITEHAKPIIFIGLKKSDCLIFDKSKIFKQERRKGKWGVALNNLSEQVSIPDLSEDWYLSCFKLIEVGLTDSSSVFLHQ